MPLIRYRVLRLNIYKLYVTLIPQNKLNFISKLLKISELLHFLHDFGLLHITFNQKDSQIIFKNILELF